MTAAQRSLPSRDQVLDLHDQDDRVADQDADQRQHAEDGDEAERRAARHQCRDHADQAERRHGDDQEQALEALQLDHQDGRHDEQHQRHHGDDRPLALGAFLDRAGGLDRVAGRQLGDEGVDRRLQLVDDGRRLRVADQSGAHGDRRDAVAPPHRRLFELVAEVGHRRERDRLAVAGRQLHVLQRLDRAAFGLARARHDIDQIGARRAPG